MPGLVPGIHVFEARTSWMAGTSPATTIVSYALILSTSASDTSKFA
jgi:hypothetical protein